MSHVKTALTTPSRSRLGRRRPVRAAFLALVATAAAVFATPAPSMASGDNYLPECVYASVSCQTGVATTAPPSDARCYSNAIFRVKVCIVYAGDFVYVQDLEADGNSALARIHSGSGNVNARWCRNSLGHNLWVMCNFDWVEDTLKQVSGGYRYSYENYSITSLGQFSNN
ncbi:hypothetical protein [Virgisporangium aurantiacum]|uniref:hypothetical protein n=1 Tax=Virgisporangium aurantiacum TaxID=175570 RepID=UPI0019503264|nr:hypothetical protein [Virgisporangium aurantiacum]